MAYLHLRFFFLGGGGDYYELAKLSLSVECFGIEKMGSNFLFLIFVFSTFASPQLLANIVVGGK